MATIYNAIYRSNDKEVMIELLAINSENYYKKYRNNLFCCEPNCFAKLSYVAMPGNIKRSYLRKWKNSPHDESCLHFTETVKSETRKSRFGVINAIVSEEQINKSQKHAFSLELMSEEEREKRREEDRRKRDNRIRRYNDSKKTEQLSLIELISNPEESGTISADAKGGRLLKRNIDTLKDKDIAKTRTIIGSFLELEQTEKRTIIRVERNKNYLDIKFEEAFFAEVPEYKEMFHLIQQFTEENGQIIIVATGEVRRNEVKDEFSVSIFDKAGLLIYGKSLVDLAREYSLGHFNF
jgi:hypothetical protein